MSKRAAIGIQDFETIITNNYFYIDKTRFIKEWWENGDSVTLITRPRRFGKTINMSMLECFFSTDYQNRTDLFDKLDIWKEGGYPELQGTYPVINLSFANVKGKNYKTIQIELTQIIKNLYSEHQFLLENNKICEVDRDFFHAICKNPLEAELSMAIHQLSKMMYQYYGKKILIFLDEYDTPLLEAFENGYWDELASFTRSLFNSTFKTNPYMDRGIMTGITRISKESIFSDLNNLEVITTTSEKYADSFGFTEKEVFDALEQYGLSNQKAKVKEWYDGFNFGKCTDIYNPWSILNFLDKKKLRAYWANTSSGKLIDTLIRTASSDIKIAFEELLHNHTVTYSLDEQLIYKQLQRNEEAIWSLLVASGYLKIVNSEENTDVNDDKPICELALTNHEVQIMFNTMIKDWFSEAKQPYNHFIKAMLQNDLEAMNRYMNHVSLQIFSYFDTGKGVLGSEPERFYHGFVLGLIAELSNEYIITSNRESGFGRYDVVIEPKDKSQNAIILEFKIHNPRKETSLEDTVQLALKQIDEKQYEADLRAKGFESGKIYKYGFAFEGKKVLIGGREVL